MRLGMPLGTTAVRSLVIEKPRKASLTQQFTGNFSAEWTQEISGVEKNHSSTNIQ
jgi:hypothetical protein